MADYFAVRINAPNHCPAPGCRVQIPTEHAFCVTHWYQLPARLRTAVYAALRAGDDNTRYRLLGEALDQLTPRHAEGLEP